MYFTLNENGVEEECGYIDKGILYHDISSIENKTFNFTIKKVRGSYGKFTILDLTKEINTTLNNLKFLIDSSIIQYSYEPHCQFKFNIEEVNSDQTFFFINNELTIPYTIIGNGYIEYCFDQNCLNNIYN